MLEKHSIYLSSTPGHHNARHVKKRGQMQRERLGKMFQLGWILQVSRTLQELLIFVPNDNPGYAFLLPERDARRMSPGS